MFKYISFYDTVHNRRSMSLAAVNKINYICTVLNKLGHHVDIISCGMVAENSIEKSTEKLYEDTDVFYFKTRKQSNKKIIRIYNYIMQNMALFCYLLKNVNKNDTIFVYHSLGLMRTVYFAKKIKKFKMILEVEEFYNDVELKSVYSKKMEEMFINIADKYIFPTILLNEKFNINNKPYVIIHGTYREEVTQNVSFGDDKIHIVYAGTLDGKKGGATSAANIAAFLPENYVVHILGFGIDSQIEDIQHLAETINKTSQAKVIYEGVLSGEEYINFLQKCHIGLSTQNPCADFNDTSFPSKILSYMANGLRVVTVKIPAITTSAIREDVYYYDMQSPEEIAKTIVNIDFNDGYDARMKISQLDEKFCENMKKLLNSEEILKK